MKLPADFIQNIGDTFGEAGRKLIEDLPDLIAQASRRWELSDVEPVPNLSFNFVAFAKRGGRDVILKMGITNPELISEMAALRLYNGDGACRLLESDEESGFLLLERLRPGTMLSELPDDDERTAIAAEVMSKLWRDAPENPARGAVPFWGTFLGAGESGLSSTKFIKLSDWFDGLKKIRPRFDGTTGPFPTEILERVESFLPELFSDQDDKLLHGDFHHFNILSSERGWLVIDPKGVIGPAGYEVGPLMINPWHSISDAGQFKVQAGRRVSILAERLGWEREKIIRWATAHAVLSAWWSMEDSGSDDEASWGYSMWCAEMFTAIK